MTAIARQSLPVESERALVRWLGGTSPHTRRAYLHDVTEWLQWCADNQVDASAPSVPDLVEYLASLKLKESTKARRYSAIRNFYAWAREEGLSVADLLPPKSQRPVSRGQDSQRLVGLTETEAQNLMAVADAHSPRAAALISLLLTTGLRISEALSIDDLTHRPGRTTVTVLGKGRKTRTVVVPGFAAERCEALRELNDRVRAGLTDIKRGDENAMFIRRSGDRLTPHAAWDTIKRLGAKAGIPHLHPHLLRHTAASLALMGGSNIQSVRAMLGHSSLGTTQRYVEAAGTLDNSPAYALAARIAPPESAYSQATPSSSRSRPDR